MTAICGAQHRAGHRRISPPRSMPTTDPPPPQASPGRDPGRVDGHDGYTAEMNFADSGGGGSTATLLDWNGIVRGGPYRITVVEDVTRTVHTWTGAFFKGAPKVDRHNGEVSGLMVRANAYARRKT